MLGVELDNDDTTFMFAMFRINVSGTKSRKGWQGVAGGGLRVSN